MHTDALDLQEEVAEALAYDPRITSGDVAVTVRDGIVTLHGTVPNLNQKWEAEEIVKRVHGVRGVADELVVDLPAMHVRDDADIALAIERRFESSPIVPPGITFVVHDGRVTLAGSARWYYQSREAEYEVRRVAGVKDVANDVVVEPAAAPSTEEILERIHSSLERTGLRDGMGVHATVAGSLVNLSGSVSSCIARDAIVAAVWSIPGVTRVDNFLSVAPPLSS